MPRGDINQKPLLGPVTLAIEKNINSFFYFLMGLWLSEAVHSKYTLNLLYFGLCIVSTLGTRTFQSSPIGCLGLNGCWPTFN